MKKTVQNLVEKLIVNSIWEVLKYLFVLLLSASVYKTLTTWFFDGQLLSDIYLVIIVLVLAILLLVVRFIAQNRLYPKNSWHFIHGNNTYTLIFKSREEAEYTKEVEVMPLRTGTKEFTDGEYNWTGDYSKAEIVEKDSFKLEFTSNTPDCQKYSITSLDEMKPYRNKKYTISIALGDKDHQMTPRNYIYIQRPTKSIKLVLCVPLHFPIKNVRFVCRTRLGEKIVLQDTKGSVVSNGGTKIGYSTYTYKIKNPKITCEYEIKWEWDEIDSE